MNKLLRFLLIWLVSMQLSSCKTDDVLLEEQPPIGGDSLVEISDIALGEYLLYNRIAGVYKLKAAEQIKTDEYKIYIDTVEVKAVKELNLVKNASAIKKLEQAGLATASIKIKQFEEISYFTGLTKLQLTSNEIASLNLKRLVLLDTLEINFNYLSELDLTSNTKLRRFRFQGSTNEAPEVRRISTINLSTCADIEHVHLKDQDIVSLHLPLGKRLKDLDLSNTPGPDGDRATADVVISQETFDNILANGGIPLGVTTGETPEIPSSNYQIRDAAFGEYLVYLTEKGDLPAGAAFLKDGSFFIDKEVAKNVTIVNIAKTSGAITSLTEAGLVTASEKITDIDGIQYFTNLIQLTATSNEIASIDIANLTKLETLQLNFNFITKLDISKNESLKIFSYNASTKVGIDKKISAIDFTKNLGLTEISMTNQNLSAVDLSRNTSLIKVDLSGNAGAPFTIPAAIYDNLTTAKGVQK